MKNKVISIIVLLAFVMMGGSGCRLFGHKKKDHNDTLSYSLLNVETDQNADPKKNVSHEDWATTLMRLVLWVAE